MRHALVPLFLLAASAPAFAQSGEKTFRFMGEDWRVNAQEAKVETIGGRETLILRGGRAWLDKRDFKDGVIEFDASYDEVQGFLGPAWRAESDDRYEELYVRSHLNEKPDAVQYTPVEHGNSAWQIFSDGNAIAAVSQKYDGWNHGKLVIKGDSADFYYNSAKPSLHIPDLKTDIKSGYVGLRVSGRARVRFSNVVFRPLGPDDKIIGAAKPSDEPPNGVIREWSVSTVFAEKDIADALTLNAQAAAGLDWQSLGVETNGIANISKIRDRFPDGDSTIFVRMRIRSDKAQIKELRFGYSDRARLYLNGKRVYYGDAGWRVRDYRFLGTVGFFDSAGLDLKKGENEVIVAISETFGGWAWAGAIEDQSGIALDK